MPGSGMVMAPVATPSPAPSSWTTARRPGFPGVAFLVAGQSGNLLPEPALDRLRRARVVDLERRLHVAEAIRAPLRAEVLEGVDRPGLALREGIIEDAHVVDGAAAICGNARLLVLCHRNRQ